MKSICLGAILALAVTSPALAQVVPTAPPVAKAVSCLQSSPVGGAFNVLSFGTVTTEAKLITGNVLFLGTALRATDRVSQFLWNDDQLYFVAADSTGRILFALDTRRDLDATGQQMSSYGGQMEIHYDTQPTSVAIVDCAVN